MPNSGTKSTSEPNGPKVDEVDWTIFIFKDKFLLFIFLLSLSLILIII